MLQLSVTVDLAAYTERAIDIIVEVFSTDELSPALHLEASLLPPDSGVEVRFFSQSPTRLHYRLTTAYTVCVGADKQASFIYPFINDQQIFLASGALPRLPDHWTGQANARIQIVNAPSGWALFSNATGAMQEAGILHSFFIFSSQHAITHLFRFSSRGVKLRYDVCIPSGGVDPLFLWNYMRRLQEWLIDVRMPYQPNSRIKVLILQAPDDFEALTKGRTFATGENMLGGIIAYAPCNPEYLERLLGYSNYVYFLCDGITHEMFHHYASSDALAKARSQLIPTIDCPPDICNLLGEALPGYLHRQYVSLSSKAGIAALLRDVVAKPLNSAEGRGSKLTALWLVDVHLRKNRSSLLELLQTWLSEHQERPVRFSSLDHFLVLVQRLSGQPLPAELRGFLENSDLTSAAFRSAIQRAAADLGYALTEKDGSFDVEPAMNRKPVVTMSLPAMA